MKNSLPYFLAFLIFCYFHPAFAEDSPEAVFQKWNDASRQGNVDGVLDLSSARSRKEADDDLKMGMNRQAMVEILKAMAPDNVKILKQTTSPDGKKTSLFVEGSMQDFFTMKGGKPKKELEKGEVQMLKENGLWKLDKQCWGGDGRCEKEDKGERIAHGKKAPLKKGTSFWTQKGKAGDFSSVKLKGNPYVVDLHFQGSDENPTLSYMLHHSPSFADFYLKVGDQKVTPSAFIEDFEKKEVKVMEASTSYSRSRSIQQTAIVSLLFDVAKDLKGTKTLWVKFTVAEQDYWFQVGE